jgi:hypothetical protein
MVAHGGTSVAGSFIQTLTMVDVATGWTECLPLVTRTNQKTSTRYPPDFLAVLILILAYR